MRWIVGNGKAINFWIFNWALDHLLIELIPPNMHHTINTNETVADYISLMALGIEVNYSRHPLLMRM